MKNCNLPKLTPKETTKKKNKQDSKLEEENKYKDQSRNKRTRD